MKKTKLTMLLTVVVAILAVFGFSLHFAGIASGVPDDKKTDNTPCARECVQQCVPNANDPLPGADELAVNDCIHMCLQARCGQAVNPGQCDAFVADGCCNVFADADPDCLTAPERADIIYAIEINGVEVPALALMDYVTSSMNDLDPQCEFNTYTTFNGHGYTLIMCTRDYDAGFMTRTEAGSEWLIPGDYPAGTTVNMKVVWMNDFGAPLVFDTFERQFFDVRDSNWVTDQSLALNSLKMGDNVLTTTKDINGGLVLRMEGTDIL